MANGRFEQVATIVTQRTAELLDAQAIVIDERGQVVASSVPGRMDRPFEGIARPEENAQLRIPIELHGTNGSMIIQGPSNGEVIAPRVVEALVHLMVNQATVTSKHPNQHDLKNKFIYDLLHGLAQDEAEVLREAKLLGMDLVPPRAVMLIDASDYILAAGDSGRREPTDAQIRRRAQLVIGSIVGFFHLPNDTICAYIGEGEVAVLKASNTKNLAIWAEEADTIDQINASWANLGALKRAGDALLARLRADTRAPLSLGIGRYHPGVQGLARSYQDARAALNLGRHFHGQNGVHCLDRLGIAAFIGVADEQTKIDLAMYLLSPLDHEPELLETLHVFFAENCCPSDTVKRLSIHRNTLGYRLDKIKSLAGLDPRRFDDAVQIRLALLMRSMGQSGA